MEFALGHLGLANTEAAFQRLVGEANVPATTPFYRAPEHHITPLFDVFAAAMTFSELALAHVTVCAVVAVAVAVAIAVAVAVAAAVFGMEPTVPSTAQHFGGRPCVVVHGLRRA